MNFLSNWLAYITKKGSESLSFPIQQFKMNGRVGDAYIVSPYGVHANLPVNQPALNLSPDGTILMGVDPVGRIKIEAGEVVFYHPVTKSKTHYKNNGDIDLQTASKAIVTAPNIELNGDVTISGNLQVGGDFNNDGAATLGGAGGNPIARQGDAVAGGVITGGSANHEAT